MTTPETAFVWVLNGQEAFGSRRAVLNLAPGVARRGHEVQFVAAAEGPFTAELRERSLPVHCLGLERPPVLRSRRPAALTAGVLATASYGRTFTAALLALVRELRPDVLHVSWNNLVDPVRRVGATEGALVVWEQTNVVRRPSSKAYFVLGGRRGRNLTVANSRYTAARWAPFAAPPVMHLGADAGTFAPGPWQRPDPLVHAVSVGRLDPTKGQHLVLDAMGRNPHWPLRYTAYGTESHPGYGRQLAAQALRLGLAGAVTFAGAPVGAGDPYRDAHLSLNLTTIPESFGLSVVESMMCGVPVLAHALGGPSDTVLDGRTGWLLDDLSPAVVDAGVARALRDVLERGEALHDAAAAHAVRSFSLEAQTERYLALVHDALRRPAR